MNTIAASIAQNLHTICPTCQQPADFHLLGTQKWPPAVTERFNLPSEIGLYRCEACHTTISEIDLARRR